MCGIYGASSRHPFADDSALKRATDTLVHRGPDSSGYWLSPDRRTALGHRRLAIVDLTPSGHQPMQDADARLTIVFNGEIYNYRELKEELSALGSRFRSASDTEVLLEAYRHWGTDCLDRLNGMFAFAIHDANKQSLFFARDRAGEKPLFYFHGNGGLHFASELKALLANPEIPRRIDHSALDAYLYMGFVPGESCLLKGFAKLPPAHAMLYDTGGNSLKLWRYWELPAESGQDAIEESGDALVNELESLLEDAVRRQLEADVKVGVLLSGGIDSSLITALACRQSASISTFTIRFPGHAAYDESAHARLIARHFGTHHVEMEAEEAGVDLLPMLARQYDEPVIDSSMFPTFLVSKLVREHCTVALGGDGGDELFGGYIHYPRLLWMASRLGAIPLVLRKAVSGAMLNFLPTGFRGKNWLAGLGTDFNDSLPLIANYFDQASRRALVPALAPHMTAETLFASRLPVAGDLLQRATRQDFYNYLPEDILVKVDRASMLNSLEIRAPFLDSRVIELAFGRLPSAMKTTVSQRKIALKRLGAKLLPAGFDLERKQGFSIPLAAWLKSGPWREYFREVLLDTSSPYDRRTVTALLKGQETGRNNAEKLFGLVLLDLWRREYSISL